MVRNRKPTPTKTVIVKIASELFFENGFTKTTSTEICKKADISPGNLTFYFPNKESILATLVQMMIDFQWKEMEAQTDEGKSASSQYRSAENISSQRPPSWTFSPPTSPSRLSISPRGI